MERGRVTIGSTVVGSFSIENNQVEIALDESSSIRLNGKVVIRLNDGCDLSEAIKRASDHGLVLGLSYKPHFDKDDERFS